MPLTQGDNQQTDAENAGAQAAAELGLNTAAAGADAGADQGAGENGTATDSQAPADPEAAGAAGAEEAAAAAAAQAAQDKKPQGKNANKPQGKQQAKPAEQAKQADQAEAAEVKKALPKAGRFAAVKSRLRDPQTGLGFLVGGDGTRVNKDNMGKWFLTQLEAGLLIRVEEGEE
jgi:hypothetical protein